MHEFSREALTDQFPPAAKAEVGVARRDVTPPVGICARNWGAAVHDTAEGLHRPLCLTVMVLRATSGAPPLVLAALDASWWQSIEDEYCVRGFLIESLRIDPARVMVSLSHTHASASICTDDADKPGGHLIAPYLQRLREALLDATREALHNAELAILTWETGRCDLACNRDLPEPDGSRIVSGFNPAGTADDTVVVGRATNGQDRILATIVNYACHPTVLAWKNRLLSPDYVGAMRETVEKNTGGAPCLFLQGASGELAPREDHSNETTIADANGRRLGLAVLATLESMLPARTGLTFGGVVESGAPLAIWKRRLFEPCTVLEAARVEVVLPLKPCLESKAEVRRQLDACTDQVRKERSQRKLRTVESVGSGSSCLMPAWIWRIGRAFLVGHPNEAYSLLQTTLRRCFPDHAVIVMNVVNGHIGYLAPPELHEVDVYTVWQSPFGPQALPRLIEACRVQMNRMLEG